MAERHVPIRTCISCRVRRNKANLLRLVLDEKGRVVRDDRGCLSGRGAYVCNSGNCLSGLKQGNRLSRAFKKNTRLVIALDVFSPGD